MRDIKFRAWGLDDKHMYRDSGVLATTSNMDWLTQPHSGPLVNPRSEKLVLMQYTGLKDKNGVEIYEGDIIEYGPYDDSKSGRYKKAIEWKENARYTGFNICVGDNGQRQTHSEVIGNIYENPELVK